MRFILAIIFSLKENQIPFQEWGYVQGEEGNEVKK